MSEYIIRAADWAIDKNGNSLYQGCEEIVRCRDCAYFATDELGDYCTLFDFEDIKDMKDGFCSWGEREDNGQAK